MDEKEKTRLLNQIKILKMKLRKAKIEQDQAYIQGFEKGFDEGMIHQVYAEELGKFEQEGPEH
jgi:hypothetical protein